jgi:hypothetical protein
MANVMRIWVTTTKVRPSCMDAIVTSLLRIDLESMEFVHIKDARSIASRLRKDHARALASPSTC